MSSVEPLTFKENILIRSVVSILFGLAAGVVAAAAFTKIFTDGGIVFIVPGLLALGLMLVLFWFFVASYNSRQYIAVTPQQLTARSRLRGEQTIYWHNLAKITETPLIIEKIRGIMPLVEIMISYYFLLPLPATSEKRGLLIFEAKDGNLISLREHLLYPHHLDQLRQAAASYAPVLSRSQLMLKSNTQN